MTETEPRRSLVPGLAVVVVLAVLLGSGGSTVRSEAAICKSVEGAAFPKLEAVAKQTLADVSYKLSRFSRCEDQGVPYAIVIAEIPAWDRLRQPTDHLIAEGWTKKREQELVSADGDFAARPGVVTEPNGTKVGDIYFMAD